MCSAPSKASLVPHASTLITPIGAVFRDGLVCGYETFGEGQEARRRKIVTGYVQDQGQWVTAGIAIRSNEQR